MDETIFEKILAVLKMKNPDEVQAARILVGTGEALVRGDNAPLEAIQKAIDKVSDATAARIFFFFLWVCFSKFAAHRIRRASLKVNLRVSNVLGRAVSIEDS